MERGRLEYQHGHDSAQVRDFDRRAAEQKAREDAEWWKRYGDAAGQTYGVGGQESRLDRQIGSGYLGPAIAILISAGSVLLILSAALYGAWRFAAEAVQVLILVWRSLLYAVLHIFDTRSAFLVAGFVLSCAALLTILRLFARYRLLRPAWQAVALFIVGAPGQILLWMAGSLLLSLPAIGPLLKPVQLQLVEFLPAVAGRTPDVATAALASALIVVGVPFIRLAWTAIYRSALESAAIGLAADNWLAARRLSTWAGVAIATLLVLMALAIPNPPLVMPVGLWTYSALVAGAMFGWRVAVVAAILAIALAQPGYRDMSMSFADGTALQRMVLWWSGFIAAAAAAGWLRPALPSSLWGELRMSLLATLFGLSVGCFAMLIIEALSVGYDYLPTLAIDYWTHTDFVPGFLPGFAVSTLIGALASLTIRNVGRTTIRLAAGRGR